ncbi:uncharacterized protein [Hetaerina americana]|uniref:uncharacterized protein n=1 Tax=Hetaerina americana TaxID=62018 RepID=UPI003A7F1A75
MFGDCFRDICRICVERSEDYIRIYDKVILDNTPFYYIINDVCQLDISENDGFPEYICKDCFLKISEFMIFKRKSHDAKLNFLSMKISLSEATNLNDVNLEKGTVVATNILVKEMTSEGVTLDVAQPGDIIEEVITVPYLVDYEEVVTDDTYTLDEEQTYVAETENILSQSPPLPAPLVDRKRNSKEREVAIILADGGRTLLPKEKENEVIVMQDTGQEVREKVADEEDEESNVSLRRSFVAQAYYRSYLLEKERREEEKASEAVAKISTSPAPDAVDNEGYVKVEEVLEFNVASEKVDLPEEETEANQEISVPMEVLPTVVEVNGVKELEVAGPELATAVQEVVESQICEEGPPKAVCCKKKMLAISKSIELSRSLELSEKKIKPETFVVESDLDVLVEACRSREVSWNSMVEKTPVESVELPVEAEGQPLETEIANDAVLSDSEEDGGVMGGTDQVNTHAIRQVRTQKVSSKASLKSARGDRRGMSQGPRFRIPCSEPAPPKRKKKEVTKQGLKFIQVIASEELRAKRQQLDLMEVEDILKKNFSGKKTIQVSEVGPSGKVFHVEPTIVKLRGIPLIPGQMIRSNSTASTETAVKNGSTKVPWRQRDNEGDNGGGDRVIVVPGISSHGDSKGCENGGEEKQDKGCTEVSNGEVTISSGSPISIDILGSDDGTPKTLLLTAPKEENSSTQALAILLRPLKQEEEEEDPLEAVEHAVRTKSLQQILGDPHEDDPEQPMTLLMDPPPMKRKLREGEEPAEEDSEIFCNRIRLRAKRAMLGCIKKTLDELEKIQGQEVEGQGETAQGEPEFAPEGGETGEGIHLCTLWAVIIL